MFDIFGGRKHQFSVFVWGGEVLKHIFSRFGGRVK